MEIRGDAPFGPTSQRLPAASWQAKWNVAVSQRTVAPTTGTSGDLRGGNSRNIHNLECGSTFRPRGRVESRVYQWWNGVTIDGLHLYCTFPAPSRSQWPLTHPFSYTFTHNWWWGHFQFSTPFGECGEAVVQQENTWLPCDLSLAAAARSHWFSFYFFSWNLSKDAQSSPPRLFVCALKITFQNYWVISM